MQNSHWLAFVLCVTVAVAVAVATETPVSKRHEDPISVAVEDRAALFFRRMDADFNKHLTADEIQKNPRVLEEQMPGITVPRFIEFMEKADTNQDKKLSKDEFFEGLAKGMQVTAPEMVETEVTVRRGKKKFIGAMVDNLKSKAGGLLRTITGGIDTSQDSCVMCQYIVERIEANIKSSGVIPALGAPGPSFPDPYSFLELDAHTIPAVALVEVETKAEAEAEAEEKADEKGPGDFVGASVIGATRASTRYQRQIERQKFNEIYRIADITLDDVCEQGMPNAYYGFCKQVYKSQTEIVDGLRYQYRPSDVCYRVGMCKDGSYITKGIHSRYRTDN